MEEKATKNLTDPFAYIKTAAALSVFLIHVRVFSSMHGYQITGSNWFMKTAGHGAVWVFFFLSGYYNIGGFLGKEPKYDLSFQGVIRFYLRRFFKILLPVWCFYLIALTVSEPAFVTLYPKTVLRLLTFTYTGEPGCSSIAATWYVSTLAWLYLLTPLAAVVCRKLDGADGIIHILSVFAAAAALGFTGRILLLFSGADWTQEVFVPFYCNIDLYLCGALSFMIAKRKRLPFDGRISYILSIAVFTVLLTVHNRIYYLEELDAGYITVYGYIMPTVYVIVMIIICLLAESAGYRYERVSIACVRRNPFRLIDAFSMISFEFYLIHSMILFHLSTLIPGTDGSSYNRNLALAGFCITVLWSLLFKKATSFRTPGGKHEAAA